MDDWFLKLCGFHLALNIAVEHVNGEPKVFLHISL